MFEKALRAGSRIILVHPESSKIKDLFSDGVKKHIDDLQRFFAQRNYAQVNQEIALRVDMLMSQLQ
jgi:hypothetical protein